MGDGGSAGAFVAVLPPPAFSPSCCPHGGRWEGGGCPSRSGDVPSSWVSPCWCAGCGRTPPLPPAPPSRQGPAWHRQPRVRAGPSCGRGIILPRAVLEHPWARPARPAVCPPVLGERHLPGARGRCCDLNPTPDARGNAQRCCTVVPSPAPSPVLREGCRPFSLQARGTPWAAQQQATAWDTPGGRVEEMPR